ncbi:NUDIX hydrolase [Zobellia galactanivorans]|uniref:NUDIX hydrolase n=1 Tax=Zobellia TaxID=112040 RepID=UPI000B53611A|nr:MULTISPECIES: NUDIX hydrolase [Zobellia]MBU3028055.1 NUDIX hydrolase [Zobellia galactanivorans]MDO6808334.1 NUDIX hydrolase [Zobellia galactanivorans]OWW26539.1 ADP-ribose pyrophosphatase [Zobellia sp. OII3]
MKQLEQIKRIKALAETGLVYAEDEYNRERYTELKQLALELLASVADKPLSVLDDFYMPVTDYPTPKVDVRGLVLNEKNQILMAKESVDGKWTIPGGWAEVGYSPSACIMKEIEEETGLITNVVRLMAVYDKQSHPHPPQPFYVYKLCFLCRLSGGKLTPGFDMRGAAFFDIDDLPEISKDRILVSQLKQLHAMAIENKTEVYFD